MAFVKKLVGPDENLVDIARLHWVYILKGLLWLGGTFIGGGTIQTIFALYVPIFAPFGNFIFGAAIVFGALMLFFYVGKLLFTELGLTTERLIYKRGVLFVDVREVDLEEIKSASVDNGVLGRILNYGYLDLDARFIDDMDLPAINDPYRFIKAMNAVRSQIKDDNMRVVLDGDGAGAVRAADAINDHKERRDVKNKSMPRGKQKHPKLQDNEFEGLSDDAAENADEIKKEVVAPEVFKPPKKEEPKETELHQNPEQRKQDLSEMVQEDFEEAEEATKQ